MRAFFIALIFSLFIGLTTVAAQTKFRLELGAILPKKDIPKKPQEMAVRCCFSPFIEKNYEGVKYTVAFNRKTREIIYLYTWDKNFKTKDGYKIGDSIDVSLDQTSKNGFTIYGQETSDGWFPVVGYTLRLPGEIENPNPFENAKQNEIIKVEILAFAKGMWGNPQE